MILRRAVGAALCGALLAGCNKSYPVEETDGTAEGRLQVLAVGLGGAVTGSIKMEVDGEQYEIFESGLFERNAADPVTGVRIADEPSDGHCALFEKYDQRDEKMVSCLPATLKIVDTEVQIGRGWTYVTHGDWKLLYSPEQMQSPAEVNGTIRGILSEVLAGTFYGDSAGEKFLYVLPGAAIGALSKLGLDTKIKATLAAMGDVMSIRRVYTYEAETFYNSEYTVELYSAVRPARLIGRAAQAVHGAVLGAEGIDQKIEYAPSSFVDLEPTARYRIATTVWPYGESDSFYAVRVAPESAMGDTHFPTTNLGGN